MKPNRILEIGIGNRILTSILEYMKFEVSTADINGSLNPDYVLDVRDASNLLELKGKYDLIIASQVFEHIKYSEFIDVLQNLRKLTNNLIITLPYINVNASIISLKIRLPFIRREFKFTRKIFFKKPSKITNKAHLWEIGIKGFPLKRIKRDFKRNGWIISKDFLNEENPYHYIFKLKSKR